MSIFSTQDLFESIIAEPKWYVTMMNAQAANRVKARWQAGTLSQEKIDEILSAAGYRKIEIWEKAPKQRAA